MDFETLVRPFSPWRDPAASTAWRSAVPRFRRPIFDRLVSDLDGLSQYLSIIGPRRVGKSTLLRQIVEQLLDRGVEPRRILYYSLDDPALLRPGFSGHELLETLAAEMNSLGQDGPAYLLLDEVQALPHWELYVKKFYDLGYAVKILLSGSASSPIFKKSRESLLGRVNQHHLLPFSYREFLLYRLRDEQDLLDELESYTVVWHAALRGLLEAPDELRGHFDRFPSLSDALWSTASEAMDLFLIDGGFPEVWEMPTAEQKIDYLFENQVQKVIFEDLVLAAEFRKPEQLKAFYVSLLESPGREVSRTKLASELEIPAAAIDKYLPLLEMTDLIRHAEKFRTTTVRMRKGNRKFYLVDLALRNAVLRLDHRLLDDPQILGLYAENLVFNALKQTQGLLAVDFYREQNREIDFVATMSHGVHWPIEVKHQRQVSGGDLGFLRRFARERGTLQPFCVTRTRDVRGLDTHPEQSVFHLPLIEFLLLLG